MRISQRRLEGHSRVPRPGRRSLKVQLPKRDITDLLRSVGGLLFAVGAVVLLVRKSGHHEWSDFARLLVVLVPAGVLYLLALGVLERPRSEDAQPWQSVLRVAAILLGRGV